MQFNGVGIKLGGGGGGDLPGGRAASLKSSMNSARTVIATIKRDTVYPSRYTNTRVRSFGVASASRLSKMDEEDLVLCRGGR